MVDMESVPQDHASRAKFRRTVHELAGEKRGVGARMTPPSSDAVRDTKTIAPQKVRVLSDLNAQCFGRIGQRGGAQVGCGGGARSAYGPVVESAFALPFSTLGTVAAPSAVGPFRVSGLGDAVGAVAEDKRPAAVGLLG